MIVYELSFWYFDEEPEDEDEVIIAVYSSRELAEKAIEKFKTHPRFAGREDDFYISEYGLNEPEWRDGFYIALNYTSDIQEIAIPDEAEILIGSARLEPAGVVVWKEKSDNKYK